MIATQRLRNGADVARAPTLANDEGPDNQALGHLTALAQRAVDRHIEALAPSAAVEHPGAVRERRAVADVLVVETGELRDPVAFVVAVEANDARNHRPIVVGAPDVGFSAEGPPSQPSDLAPRASGSVPSGELELGKYREVYLDCGGPRETWVVELQIGLTESH